MYVYVPIRIYTYVPANAFFFLKCRVSSKQTNQELSVGTKVGRYMYGVLRILHRELNQHHIHMYQNHNLM